MRAIARTMPTECAAIASARSAAAAVGNSAKGDRDGGSQGLELLHPPTAGQRTQAQRRAVQSAAITGQVPVGAKCRPRQLPLVGAFELRVHQFRAAEPKATPRPSTSGRTDRGRSVRGRSQFRRPNHLRTRETPNNFLRGVVPWFGMECKVQTAAMVRGMARNCSAAGRPMQEGCEARAGVVRGSQALCARAALLPRDIQAGMSVNLAGARRAMDNEPKK
jgi:hypothetical protein